MFLKHFHQTVVDMEWLLLFPLGAAFFGISLECRFHCRKNAKGEREGKEEGREEGPPLRFNAAEEIILMRRRQKRRPPFYFSGAAE